MLASIPRPAFKQIRHFWAYQLLPMLRSLLQLSLISFFPFSFALGSRVSSVFVFHSLLPSVLFVVATALQFKDTLQSFRPYVWQLIVHIKAEI